MLKRRCATLTLPLRNVAQCCFNIGNPMPHFLSFSTSDQTYFNVDPQRANNVDPTLKCWIGLCCSMSLLLCQAKYILFASNNLVFTRHPLAK